MNHVGSALEDTGTERNCLQGWFDSSQFNSNVYVIFGIEYNSCRKFTFENFTVSRKNVVVGIKFFIRILFVCFDSMP